MCVYISSLIQFAHFLSLFELVSLLCKQINAFKAYVLLLFVFYSNAGAVAGYTFYPHMFSAALAEMVNPFLATL